MFNPEAGHAYNETAALLLLVETSIDKLHQPTTVISGLTEHLLEQTEKGTPLAKDLAIIATEMRHVNEVVRGLSLLTNYPSSSALHD